MGRRAKYLTAAAKHQASRGRRKFYEQTQHHKNLRISQNRRAYLKLTESESTTTTPNCDFQLPTLPPQLISLTLHPLPTSQIFWGAVSSAEDLTEGPYSETSLNKWEGYPPYAGHIDGKKERLIDTLYGRRMRLQGERETARIRQYKTTPIQQFMLQVHSDLTDSLKDFDTLNGVLGSYPKDSVDREIGWHLLRWKALCVQGLLEDLEALLQGSDKFILVYTERCYRNKWF